MIRRSGIFSMIVLSIFLLCGQTAPQQCNEANTGSNHLGAEILGTGIAIVAVVTITTVVLVHNAHHRMTGCVYSTPDGFTLVNESDKKTYMLQGTTTDLKIGDRIKIHGNHVKSPKGDKTDPVFVIEKLSKDYGICKVPPPTATPAAI